MIPFDEALKLVSGSVHALPAVNAKIADALGCAAAQDISARFSNPLFDNSQMDGYAVISQDLSGASKDDPVVLKVTEELPAGRTSSKELKSGNAVRIMTGAPLPKGADAVVAVEDTMRDGGNVKIFHAAVNGEYVRRAGEDIKVGETFVTRGRIISPAEILAISAQGAEETSVVRRPKVAIIATGDELAYVGQELTNGHIYNASSPMLSALVRSAGAVPFDMGIVPDDAKLIAEKLCDAIGLDMILMTGGVSIGDYDMNRRVLTNMGFREIFWRVAIKPGKPLLFGTLEGKPVFGLPGNPISTMTAFHLFVYPAIRNMMGVSGHDTRRISAKLATDVERDSEREQFLLAQLNFDNGTAHVTAFGPQSSAHFKPALSANCIARIPKGEGVHAAGNIVEAWTLSICHQHCAG